MRSVNTHPCLAKLVNYVCGDRTRHAAPINLMAHSLPTPGRICVWQQLPQKVRVMSVMRHRLTFVRASASSSQAPIKREDRAHTPDSMNLPVVRIGWPRAQPHVHTRTPINRKIVPMVTVAHTHTHAKAQAQAHSKLMTSLLVVVMM